LPGYQPDREIELDLPSIVIYRLKEDIRSGRLQDEFFSKQVTIQGEEIMRTVYSKRMVCKYQFDLMTRDLNSQFKLSSYLDKKFHGVKNNIVPYETISFPIKNFGARINNKEVDNIPDSDVSIFWRPKNISVAETSAFNTEFEQITYTLDFWADFWYINNDYVITDIQTTFTDINTPSLIY
jgi:hypothetical protein